MDITITAPKSRSLVSDKESFLQWKNKIKEGLEPYIYFRLAWLPTQDKKIKKCYVINKGYIRGYFEIKGFISIIKGSHDLLRGRYLMLITNSWVKISPIKARGHRNFKYVTDDTLINNNSKNILIQMYEELERRCQN